MEVYPKVKVKVRVEEDDDQYALELSSLQSLKGFDSLSPFDSSPDDSPTSIVRIPSSDTSSPASSADPVSKGSSDKKQVVSDENKQNIRAGPVPRPRAVLSSPDNDSMIGTTNKTREELLTTTKNHNLCRNRHTQCKVIPRQVIPEAPKNKSIDSMKAGDRKNDIRTRRKSVIDGSSERSRHLKGKPESLRGKTSSKLTMDK